MDAVTRYLGVGSYAQWDEQTRQSWLLTELQGKRPLLPRDSSLATLGFDDIVQVCWVVVVVVVVVVMLRSVTGGVVDVGGGGGSGDGGGGGGGGAVGGDSDGGVGGGLGVVGYGVGTVLPFAAGRLVLDPSACRVSRQSHWMHLTAPQSLSRFAAAPAAVCLAAF